MDKDVSVDTPSELAARRGTEKIATKWDDVAGALILLLRHVSDSDSIIDRAKLLWLQRNACVRHTRNRSLSVAVASEMNGFVSSARRTRPK